MNLPARDDIHLLAGAYALDALDDLERRRFEEHLRGCPTCQHDVTSFAPVVGSLAGAAAELPPPALRAGVLAEIDTTRQVSSSTRGVSPRRTTFGRVATAAAVAAALVLATLTVHQHRVNQSLARRAAIIEAPDARTTELAATAGSAGTIRVTYSASRRSAVLLAHDLPPAPPNRTYELWIIENGAPQPSITFQTDSNHRATIAIDTAPPAGSQLAVTEEPRGGSRTPTSPPTHVSSRL